jgi:predicted MPP superfamily phosphohydrolase
MQGNMILSLFLFAVIALGHGVLCIWLINVSHGFGLTERWFRWVEGATLALGAILPCVMLRYAIVQPWTAWPAPLFGYSCLCLVLALLALPAVTLFRALRREPPEIARGPRVRESAQPAEGTSWTGHGPRAAWLRFPGNQALEIWSSECEVKLAKLPPELDGLRITHISDFHCSDAFDRGYFDAVVDAVAAIESDLVLFTGDMIDSGESLAWIAPLFSRLRGRLGQFAILGNHDLSHGAPRIYRALLKAGFSILEGRWTVIETEGARVVLGGTSYPWGRRLDLAGAPEGDVHVLLSHSPDLFPTAARHGIDLMLSGHNHGGQVRIPVIGPVLMPSRYSRWLDRGFFRRGDTLLHVSPGIGAKHPLRINCPPEIVRIVLRANPRPKRQGGLTTPERGALEMRGAGSEGIL